MELYIFRHAEAVELGQEGALRDFDRMLTDKGRLRSKLSGAAMNRLGIRFDAILSSPAARALETAKIAARAMNIEGRVQECKALWSGESKTILDACRDTKCNAVCIVGHEPTLGELVGMLATGDEDVGIPLKKAGMARIDIVDLSSNPWHGVLRWVLTGKQLGLIGRSK